jgi:hypothetical protein
MDYLSHLIDVVVALRWILVLVGCIVAGALYADRHQPRTTTDLSAPASRRGRPAGAGSTPRKARR